jgi:Carboxypeptidase regulatory-like domain
MKKISTMFTLALILTATFTAKAVIFTGDVNGQITEKETNQPVAFAQVVLINGNEKITLTANEYGYYSAKHIPMGKYEMHVVVDNHDVIANNVKVKDSANSTYDYAVSNTEKQAANGKQVAKPGTETGQGEVVIKYGTVIQDGQIMIIRNKPVSLYA